MSKALVDKMIGLTPNPVPSELDVLRLSPSLYYSILPYIVNGKYRGYKVPAPEIKESPLLKNKEAIIDRKYKKWEAS